MEPNPDTALTDWFEGALGQSVLREEASVLRKAIDDVFGFEFLQVGTWGPGRALLAGARTPHTTLVAPCIADGISLCAPLDMLPFASDSIDAILLPHTLELVEDPYAVLREAERVLCAEGCLMICGFNPLSGWGVRRLFARAMRRSDFPPQTRRLLTEGRLRDWVALLGFDVDQVTGYLRSPLLSGAYLLKARKRVQTLTPVRKKSRARKRVLIAVPEATTNAQRSGKPRP
ncbi:MAG: class I SAM-dependent methyltransferase [Steroidobacterales bacterium]